MSSIKGPAVFLAQFLRDEPPFDALESIAGWFAELGYRGVQIPGWDPRTIDLDQAAESKTYCDDYCGGLKELGLEVTELAGYLQGQVLAVHPVYAEMFAGFHPPGLGGDERTAWASDQIRKLIAASAHMGTPSVPVLSGGFAWQMVYPWPQRPAGIIDEAFNELAARLSLIHISEPTRPY